MSEAKQHPHLVARGHLRRARRHRPARAGAALLAHRGRDPGPGAALPGEHTDAVLADWGFAADEVEALLASGAVTASELSRAPDARRVAAASSSSSASGDGDVPELAAGARRLAVVVQVRARHREHRVAVGHLADAVQHRARAACARSSPAATRAPRGGGSRTGSSPRPRSSSAPSCGRVGRSRWRAARRPRRTARPRARRRGRGRRAGAARAPRRASAARHRPPGAGARLTRRIPPSWWFSTSGQHADRPVDARAPRAPTARGRTAPATRG